MGRRDQEYGESGRSHAGFRGCARWGMDGRLEDATVEMAETGGGRINGWVRAALGAEADVTWLASVDERHEEEEEEEEEEAKVPH